MYATLDNPHNTRADRRAVRHDDRVETHCCASLRRACANRHGGRAVHVETRHALSLRYATNFLLASILFLGLFSCQNKNEEPPIEPEPPVVVVPEPPEWYIPPMPPPNSEDPTLLPTVEISTPQGCGWGPNSYVDMPFPRSFCTFIYSYNELKECLYCGGNNYNIPTVDFNTYTMLVFGSNYGDTIIHQVLRKESDSVYNWHLKVENTNIDYWESVILTPKLPQDSRIKISIDYKEVVTTTPFVLEGCGITNIRPDTVYIINSSEELACESALPQIDFSKQTLLIAVGGSTSGIAHITAELSKTGTEYVLAVDVLQDLTDVIRPWKIVVLTDKITTNNIKLNVNYRHN